MNDLVAQKSVLMPLETIQLMESNDAAANHLQGNHAGIC